MYNAETALKALLDAMTEMNLTYERENEYTYTFAYSGDDLPMYFRITVDAEKQLVVLLSPQQFFIKPEMTAPVAAVISQINYSLADGSFDFDITSGTVIFRMTSSFVSSYISSSVLKYMIECAVYTVDEYNDKLLLINEGAIDPYEYLKKIKRCKA